MIDALEIPAGSRIFLGAPANPMPKEAADLLHQLVSEESGVIEAHIPQCYAPPIMTEPRQVLFMIYASGYGAKSSISSIKKRLAGVMAPGEVIDIVLLEVTDELVVAVRGAGCQIYQQKN